MGITAEGLSGTLLMYLADQLRQCIQPFFNLLKTLFKGVINARLAIILQLLHLPHQGIHLPFERHQ